MPITVEDIQALVADFSIEITPKSFQEVGNLRPYLPQGTRVYVTYLAGSQLEDTLETVKEISRQGFHPVPHIAARNFRDEEDLHETLFAYERIGVKELLLIAGAQEQPKGKLESTLEILQTNLIHSIHLQSLGFAGHPEGHPIIRDAEIWQALQVKQNYADSNPEVDCYLVTQICFLVQPLVDWCNQLKKHSITMPVHIGIPGLASTSSLIKHARACGVGASINFLKNNFKNMSKLIAMDAPDQLVYDLVDAKKTGQIPHVERLHFYPLGGFAKTAAWIQAIQSGNIEIKERGFYVIA